jgi:hypothetical protein
MMKQVNQLFAELRQSYLRQGPLVRILLPGSVLLMFCCICLLLIPLFVLRPSSPVPGPVASPSGTPPASPTALFDVSTLTPFSTPTFFVPTAFPSFTPSLTATHTLTPTPPPATATPVPTDTATATPTKPDSVLIIHVDKAAEYAEIQNFTSEPVNLRGWRLVSERGGEACPLRGTLEPDAILRIWARRGDPGFDCRLGREIWVDNEADPAVLYNAEGEEVSRYP